MLENLFTSQIWKASLKIEDEIKEDIINQINVNYKKYNSYHAPWNCEVHSSLFENNDLDYSSLAPFFQKEYEIFSKQINLKKHNYLIRDIWYNYYIKGSNQEPHHHTDSNESLYSAVFFLKLNQNHPPITFFNPTNYNIFYSLNKDIKNLYCNSDINHSIIYDHFDLKVKENDFVIFPSYLLHGVFIQKNTEPRISISMNFCLNKMENENGFS